MTSRFSPAIIKAATLALADLADARRRHHAAQEAFREHVQARLRRQGLSRAALRARLPGWSSSKLGNFLHLGQSLAVEDMAQLAAALAAKPTPQEKALAKPRRVAG